MGTTQVSVGEHFGVEVIRGEKKMGNWTIVVEGSGAHRTGTVVPADSEPSDSDVEKLLADFLEALALQGHIVDHATVTAPTRQEMNPRIAQATE